MSPLKIIIVVLLIGALLSLSFSLKHIIKNKDEQSAVKTTKGLTLRIVLSLIVFGLIIAGFYLGWIQPHDIGR